MSTGLSSQRAAASGKRISDDDRIFRDPALDAFIPTDDPLVRFVGKYWRLLLVLLVAYGAVWLGQIAYRQNRTRRADRASEAFARAHETFERFLSAQRVFVGAQGAGSAGTASPATEAGQATGDAAKEKQGELAKRIESARKNRDDARATLVEQLKIVEDEGGNYERIGHLYEALAQATTGERTAAESAVSPYVDWRSLKPEAGERILAELAAYVRSKIQFGIPDGKGGAGAELTALASEGRYLNAAAALALASAATTDEEKAVARDVVQRVRAAHPEQIDLLGQEMRKLGWE